MLTDFQNSYTDRLSGKLAIRSSWNILPHLRCVTTLPCEIFMVINCLFLLKNMLSKLLHATVLWNYLFISPDLCPPNSPDLNPVDYKIWGVMQQRIYQTNSRMWTTWSDVWLTCGLICSRASLTMQLTSGGSVCTPVFEPKEDSLSMHCDSRTCLLYTSPSPRD